MRRYSLAGGAIVSISLFLGAASVWSEGSPYASGLFVRHVLTLVLAQTFFFLVMPRFAGQALQVFVAMVAGAGAGWALAGAGDAGFVVGYVGILGALFIDLLKMVIIPLVFVSLLCGVAGLGDARKVGAVGSRSLTYFMLTTALAVIVGLTFVNVLEPGRGVAREMVAEQTAAEYPDAALGVKIQQEAIPRFVGNPIMADQPILRVIFFALLLGAAIAASGEKGEPALRVFRAIDLAMTTLVHWVMLLAPVGVFALMAKAIATMGMQYIVSLGKYCLTVMLGLCAHWCILVFLLVPLLARMSPLRFIRAMSPAMQLAFSTSSSTATLPVSIDCATNRLGLRRDVCSFVLPLGATINMDGTALYQAVAAVFISQVYAMHLSLQQQAMVFFTAVIVSIGTAGIPGASVGLMSITLASAGIPVEGIGIIIGVDRFLDMSRTVVNVTGDYVGSAYVHRKEESRSETK